MRAMLRCLLLLLLVAGCPGPTPEETERVEGHLLPPPDPGADVPIPAVQAPRTRTERAVVIDRVDAAAFAPAEAALPLLHLEGRPLREILPSGLPRPDRPPTFTWSSAQPVEAWPFEVTVPLPDDDTTWILAWLDRDGDAALSPGDPISAPAAPVGGLVGDAPLTLRLERVYAAAGADALLEGPDVVVIQGSDAARALTGVQLLLSGYQAAEVSSLGLPDRPAPPSLRWSSGKDPISWPVRVKLDPRGQSGLKLVAALDVDGNGVMSPGDLIGTPDCPGFPPPGAGTCTLRVDRPLPAPPQ